MQPTLFLTIVAWNSMKFLPELFRSLEAQTIQEFKVLVIDNGSSDHVESFLREQYPQAVYLRNARNLGFAPAHNQGIRYILDHTPKEQYDQTFILATNPDLILTPTYLEELLCVAVQDKQAGVFGGKLLRAFGDGESDEVLKETITSDRIDSTGLRLHADCSVSDRGAGELDQGQYDEATDVFGVSGALALYRASALESVRFEDEFFDHDFFAYKEDVDLSWRLRRQGWSARFVPRAVAHHHRGMYRKENIGLWEKMRNRRSQPRARTLFSTRNHVWMLLKNLSLSHALMASPRLVWSELMRFGYVALCEPANLRAYGQMIKGLPRMWRKRQQSTQTQRARPSEIRAFTNR